MKNRGITLIALIITIIVMLILVAVTISMAVNGGLFGYAGNAAKDTELAKQDEQKLGGGQIKVDDKKYNSPEDFIKGIEADPDYSSSLLDPSTGVLTKNAIYTDSNNATVEIPKGFGVVENYNVINQGLVISDKFDSNGNSIGNEFVWIPVEFTKTNADTNNNGLDDGFESVFYRSSWSNNARGTNYTTGNTYMERATYDLTGKYNEMMLSVQEHRGFYIGRYEAGQKENGNIVVQRDKKPYVKISLLNSSSSIGTTGAVYLSRNMYTGDTHNVTSTLCYGVQWDAMLDFVKDSTHNVNVSTDWGNVVGANESRWTITRTTAQYYKNNQWNAITEDLTKSAAGYVLLTTGANDNFMAKNIYDIAGNADEWTMETIDGSQYVYRGGSYDQSGTSYPAGSRQNLGCTGTRDDIGFRVALYL